LEDTNHLLSCVQLTKIYAKKKTKALNSVTFSVPTSGIFVLIGRNGSGKTTLVRILSTELEPTSGTASINGIDVVSSPKLLRERIAIVPQEARTVPWMTPMQTVSSYLLWRGFDYGEARKKAFEALDKIGLRQSAYTMNRALSGGNKRKVLVATVLASEAEIIFLDEPTTGLDPISRKEFWNLLEEIGKERFTFLTTHYLEEAEALADRIGILENGKLIRMGTLDQLRESVNYSYSMRIPLTNPPPPIPKRIEGEVLEGKDGYRILTVEEEAFRISRELSRGGYKFTMNPLSLDDIFSYLVNREKEAVNSHGNKGETETEERNQQDYQPREEEE
jgi:ABC-2 type transport system ATP-binding protein